MKYKDKYSIGDMSRIGNISKKALRYYDKIGLITSRRQDFNNYRYYTRESLLLVPVLKFYKQMGFTLDEMRAFIEGRQPDVYRQLRQSFLSKIEELRKQQEDIQRQYVSVKDWNDLILEAETVIDNNIHEVSVKYLEPVEFLFQEQEFDNDNQASIINIDFTNYVESLGNEITGPVILNFASFRERMEGRQQRVRIMQKSVMPAPEEAKVRFGGCMMAACYHIGPHETLPQSYERICRWSRQHGYTLGQDSVERFVTDYWTTNNSAQFVTEIMIKVSRPGGSE